MNRIILMILAVSLVSAQAAQAAVVVSARPAPMVISRPAPVVVSTPRVVAPTVIPKTPVMNPTNNPGLFSGMWAWLFVSHSDNDKKEKKK